MDSFIFALVHDIRIFINMTDLFRNLIFRSYIYTSSINLPLPVQLQKQRKQGLAQKLFPTSSTWEIGIWLRQPVLTELWKCLEQRPQKLEGHFLASHLWFNLAHASEFNSNKIIFIDHQLKFFIRLEMMFKEKIL